MIPETTLYLLASGASALVFVALVVWLPRVEAGSRGICAFVTGVVGVAAVTNLLTGLGVGGAALGATGVNAPLLVNDVVAYGGFFALAGVLAGASRTYVVALGAVAVVQRVAFEFANAGIVEGVAVLAVAGVVVGGWFVHLYLFLGPVWAAAQDVPAGRRLLHWKCRNLLLFLIGMLIVFAMLILGGALDLFVQSLTNVYISFLIRAGLAGFIFVNAGEISGVALEEALVGDSSSQPG